MRKDKSKRHIFDKKKAVRASLLLGFFLFIHLFTLIGSSVAFSQDSCRVTLDKKTSRLYDDGINLFRKGNYVQAAVNLRNVIREEPACVDAYYVLGLINFKKANANFSEAEKYFTETIRRCPGYDPYAYYYLGEINYVNEKFDTVVRYMTEFLKDVDKVKSDADYNRATELLKFCKFYLEMVHKPVPFLPEVVDGISTPMNEYLPALSPDNQMAFFTREIKIPGDKNSVVQTPRSKEKFMFSLLNSDGKFTIGEEMPEPFNINDNEGGATLTADNKFLYYTVCRFDKVKRYLNCDIFYSEYSNDEWSPIKSVGNKINLAGSWESQPSISADGHSLYFVSDRTGGYGGYDIYRSSQTENGDWGAPVNLGSLINSTGNEKSPFIHPDGKTLYFSSDGWPGLGGYDIFFSRLQADGAWSKPKNIGYPINSPEDEVGSFVSTDGTQGFFASNKLSGKGGWDLYSFDLYDEARPDKVLFIKGTVKSESDAEPVKARIELTNIDTKKTAQIPLDTNTGKYVAVTSFNSDYIMTVKKEGYVYESRYIARIDSSFRNPAEVNVEIKPIELNQSYRINDIYFGFNSFDLTSESKVVLDELIGFLNENPTIFIQIQGHTDNIGNDAANLKLSGERAKSVYNYLIEKGIESKRLTFQGFGKSMPVATNATEEGRAKNRRTVFVITRK